MTARPGLFVANAAAGVTAPQDARLAAAGLLSGAPGVMASAGGAVVTGSTSGPNMKYTVAAGVLATQRGTEAADGDYVWSNDGPLLVDSGAPAPSSGTRWDLIWARALNANDGFGDANSTPVLGVTVGTSGGSPTKPYASVPAGALVLAESNVGTSIANASLATITQVSKKVVARGGIQPVPSSGSYPSSPYEGQYVDDAALDSLVRYNGSAWTPVSEQFVVSGTPVSGSYSSTAPVKWFARHQAGTTDASGLIAITLANSCLVSVQAMPETGSFGSIGMLILRNDLSDSTQVKLQLRSLSTGNALASTSYSLSALIAYQA